MVISLATNGVVVGRQPINSATTFQPIAKPPTLPTSSPGGVLVTLSAIGKATASSVDQSLSVSAAITAFKAAQAAGNLAGFAAVTIKDDSHSLTGGTNLSDLSAMAKVGKITGIKFKDTKPVLIFDRTTLKGDLSDTASTDGAILVLQKINSAYTLTLTNVGVADLATLKPPSSNATLQIAVMDTATHLTQMNYNSYKWVSDASVSQSEATQQAATATLNGVNGHLLTLDNAAEAAAVHSWLSSTHPSTVWMGITDAGHEGPWTYAVGPNAGKTITYSNWIGLEPNGGINENVALIDRDTGGWLDYPDVPISAGNNAYGFVEKFENTKGGDFQFAASSNMDKLEQAALAKTLTSISVSDKTAIVQTGVDYLAHKDAIKLLSGNFSLSVSALSASDAIAFQSPSKSAKISLTISDTAANIAANIDKLEALAKSKMLSSITINDLNSPLTLTSAQLKADGDVLKLVQGNYSVSATMVAVADTGKLAASSHVTALNVVDSAVNVLKNITALITGNVASKLSGVTLTDKTNPIVTIKDAFALSQLPNLSMGDILKFNILDTASNVIAHGRYDHGHVLAQAGNIALADKTTPNLTLDDAKVLLGLNQLDSKTKFAIADGAETLTAEAKASPQIVLPKAANIQLVNALSIADATAIGGIKALDKTTNYSIADTAANILLQAAKKTETILSKAITVNIVDSSVNILAKLDQIEILAKSGKLSDIRFTDTPSGTLSITNTQLANDAEAIGKITSPRLLPLQATTFQTGNWPVSMAYDGKNIWVGNVFENSLAKLDPKSGNILFKVSTADEPYEVLKAGNHIWESNFNTNSVSKYALDGTLAGTYSTGSGACGLAYVGTNIWVTNFLGNTITKLDAGTGAVLGTFSSGGTNPYSLTFDGKALWAINVDGNVTKMDTDGHILATTNVGLWAHSAAYDGKNLWVTVGSTNQVAKVDTASSSVMGLYGSGGSNPDGICFDGKSLWVANTDSVANIDPSTGAVIRTISIANTANPYAAKIIFDGSSVWTSDPMTGTITRYSSP